MFEIAEVVVALLIGVGGGVLIRRRWTRSRQIATGAVAGGTDRLPTVSRDFLRVLYHELRSPCSSVAALARACGRLNELDEPSRAEALDLIQRHAEHLNAILDDVREVADSMNHTSTESTCSLSEVVRTSAACAGLPTDRLRLELASESVFVSTSASALGRILTNLLQNAVRYGPPGSPVRVVTRRCPQTGRTEVAVQDCGNGPGGSSDRQVVGAMGLGSQVVDELTVSLGGSVSRRRIPDGYEVAVRLPDHRAAPSPRRSPGSLVAAVVGPGRPLAGP